MDFYNIDKINCIIQKKVEGETVIYNTKSTPKVIYKPIFFRTYDLQDITLKTGLQQNIGINLSEYMTKVECFKLSIDGNSYTEFARNDSYVIFKIDSTVIGNLSGQYHVLNEDNDYISSGNYTITSL